MNENSILLMDNAKIHHVASVYTTMDAYELDHIYLPPYSPDYQPIELLFSFIKLNLTPELSLYDSIEAALKKVTQRHLQAWILHCAKNWTSNKM